MRLGAGHSERALVATANRSRAQHGRRVSERRDPTAVRKHRKGRSHDAERLRRDQARARDATRSGDGDEVYTQTRRSDFAYELIEHLHDAIPVDVAVTVLADRGFGDQKFYALRMSLGWDFVIRFRQCILVEDDGGTQKAAEEWVPTSDRATMLKDVRITNDRARLPAIDVVHQAKRKEPWCLATSLSAKSAPEIVALYARRFTIEETFRDAKDLRFGDGAQRDPHSRCWAS